MHTVQIQNRIDYNLDILIFHRQNNTLRLDNLGKEIGYSFCAILMLAVSSFYRNFLVFKFTVLFPVFLHQILNDLVSKFENKTTLFF